LPSAFLATLTANAYSGSSHGIAGMTLTMWRGVAFIGSTETALAMTRQAARAAEAPAASVVPAAIEMLTAAGRPALSLAWPVTKAATGTAEAAVGNPAVKRSATRPQNRSGRPAKVAAIVARTPDITGAELGRKLGLSERQGRRVLAAMNA
jgi:hypothetical protein